jgi:hypothetical protein
MNKQKVFKQIGFDDITGKIFLVDFDNNSYECNLYGEKIPKFLPNITGFSSYRERLESGNIKNKTFNIDRKLYRPQSSKYYIYITFYQKGLKDIFNFQGQFLSHFLMKI